ncbi:MAG: lipoate--protein ligase family protein [Longimicrobiales bacterium]
MKELRWRILVDPALRGFENMARDHALATSLEDGEGVLRLYRWDPPTISFGRNEPSRGRYRDDVAREEGVGFVRRPTGGRAVLHHRELTYALVFPLEASGGLKASYRRINQGLLAGIQALGAEAELAAASGRSLPPDAGPCFRHPAEGEVTALGRKLIGSAQVKIGRAVLQHGSIILDGDQEFLRRVRGDAEELSPPATLKSLLGIVPELDGLAGALQRGLAAVLGGSWEAGGFRENEKRAAEALEDHYLDPGWTWRV